MRITLVSTPTPSVAPSARTVLVALDGSPRAAGVLAKAIAVARSEGARLVLLRSIGLPADVPQDFWKTTVHSLSEVLNERAVAYLDDCQRSVPEEARGGTKVIVGSPWQSICETADGLHADLIVIGSHGYAGADRILGTTAAKVVNHAHCSVLVVRDPVGQPS
jgi:nucleotide-binding universal stress UspA family protein